MAIIRTRTLTADDLRERMARLRNSDTTHPGLAECEAFELEDARAKLARAEAGETIREGYDTTYRAWVDVD